MEPQAPDHPAAPPRRPPLLPVAIFGACLAYFAVRFWASGEHIYGLLAFINALGLAMTALGRRRRP